MNIQQGRHESQGKTCRVINECCERLKNNHSKNVRQKESNKATNKNSRSRTR